MRGSQTSKQNEELINPQSHNRQLKRDKYRLYIKHTSSLHHGFLFKPARLFHVNHMF